MTDNTKDETAPAFQDDEKDSKNDNLDLSADKFHKTSTPRFTVDQILNLYNTSIKAFKTAEEYWAHKNIVEGEEAVKKLKNELELEKKDLEQKKHSKSFSMDVVLVESAEKKMFKAVESIQEILPKIHEDIKSIKRRPWWHHFIGYIVAVSASIIGAVVVTAFSLSNS